MEYRIRFVDFPEHYRKIKSEVDSVIQEVLIGGDYILRRHLKEFEKNFAKFLDVKYAIGVANGTDALFLSLKAANITESDEVITVAHTFAATVSTISQCNAKPILVDIDQYHNIDVSCIEAAITEKTKGIIPVHLNGRICDMDAIMKIASDHGLHIIEDAAQAVGARYKGRRAGSFGLTGCFSFYPAKILGTLGDGGMIVTNNKEIAKKLFLLRDHGQDRGTGEFLFHGFNSRLDNLHAAILKIKLNHLPQWIERRRELANLYHEGLSDLDSLQLPPAPNEGNFYDVYQNYVIRSNNRDELVTYLRNQGIEILVSWPKPLHKHKALNLDHFNLPLTEQISREVLSLPLHPELSDSDVDFVINSIHNFYE